MARKVQKLLNYRTSGTSMPQVANVDFGEVVVRYATNQPELLIKKKNGEFATFKDASALTIQINTAIEAAENTASGELKAFSSYVITNYATSADTESAIKSASGNIETTIKAISGATVKYVQEVSGNIESTINAVKTDVSNTKNDLDALSSSVRTNYATSANTESAIKALSSSTIGYIKEVSGNIESKIIAVSGNIETTIKSASASIETTINGVKADVATNQTNITNLTNELHDGYWTSSVTETKISDAVNAAVSTVYRVKGSVADKSALDDIENPVVGDVYNVIAAYGNPGDADYTPAGTNYVYIKDGEGAGHWDALGGTVDLTAYAKKDEVETSVQTVSNALNALSSSVQTNYATSANTEAAIKSASGNIETTIKAISGATVGYIKEVSGNIESTINAVKTDVSNTKNDLDTLSSSVRTNYATSANTESAIKSASGNIETTIKAISGATVGYIKEVSGNIESKIIAVSGDIATTIAGVKSDVTTVSNNLRDNYATSADTVTALNGKLATAEFAEVTADQEATEFNSGAKMVVSDNGASKKLTIDLSTLIIDCGEF